MSISRTSTAPGACRSRFSSCCNRWDADSDAGTTCTEIPVFRENPAINCGSTLAAAPPDHIRTVIDLGSCPPGDGARQAVVIVSWARIANERTRARQFPKTGGRHLSTPSTPLRNTNPGVGRLAGKYSSQGSVSVAAVPGKSEPRFVSAIDLELRCYFAGKCGSLLTSRICFICLSVWAATVRTH